MNRGFSLLLAPTLLSAAPSSSPPPAVLAPYIVDGRFDPGDYHWLRGRFTGASAVDRATTETIMAWRSHCRAQGLVQTRSELAALGATTVPALDALPYRDPLCGQIAAEPGPLHLDDWDGFVRDVAVVRPIAEAYLSAVTTAETVAAPPTSSSAAVLDGTPLAQALTARAIGEQVLRFGFGWANGVTPDSPVLTPSQHAILVSRLVIATTQRDHANTQWLKTIVARYGWPRRSKVGDHPASTAWLLVQHADADPAFQLTALRLMAPLVGPGEVDRKNYAYLYDRVMLKIAGRQRYGTQMMCLGGRYVAQPVEDETAVPARRREAGMGTVAEYEQQMVKVLGPCPPAKAGGPDPK